MPLAVEAVVPLVVSVLVAPVAATIQGARNRPRTRMSIRTMTLRIAARSVHLAAEVLLLMTPVAGVAVTTGRLVSLRRMMPVATQPSLVTQVVASSRTRNPRGWTFLSL